MADESNRHTRGPTSVGAWLGNTVERLGGQRCVVQNTWERTGPPRNETIEEKLARITREREARKREQWLKGDVVATPPQAIQVRRTPETEAGREKQGTAERGGIEKHVQMALFGSLQGRFDLTPITAGNEFPTVFTRLPLFPPGKRVHQKGMLDADNALAFTTPWGRGKRYGPPLTTEDEDTLMALLRLRAFAVRGDGSRLPIAVEEGDEHTVHAMWVRISDIQRELGVTKGGRANALRMASVERLGATTIQLEFVAGQEAVPGKQHRLMSVEWSKKKGESHILVQFSPLVTKWLASAYSFIDWEVRRQLSPGGKAIHRFLSGQSKNYTISASKLCEVIGYTRSKGSFMRDLRETLMQLKKLGWLKSYTISGTGRRRAFMINTVR